MKKILVLLCSAGVLFLAGCSGDKVSPEEVGKEYMAQRFAGAEANLTDLKYTVEDSGEEMATVSIEGTITYKERIFLKKSKDTWVVTEMPAPEEVVAEELPAPVEEAAEEVATEEEVVTADAHADTHAAPEETHAPVKEASHH